MKRMKSGMNVGSGDASRRVVLELRGRRWSGINAGRW
jgi:hypothetical protein